MKKLSIIFGFILLTLSLLGQTKVVSSNVNFRTSPGIKENVICVISKGMLVTIVNDSIEHENWTRVKYDGKTGYVYKEYIVDFKTDTKDISGNNFRQTEIKYYKNSKGEMVQSPTFYKSPPAGATAECNDGTFSFSRNRRGTCSRHGGVKRWL